MARSFVAQCRAKRVLRAKWSVRVRARASVVAAHIAGLNCSSSAAVQQKGRSAVGLRLEWAGCAHTRMRLPALVFDDERFAALAGQVNCDHDPLAAHWVVDHVTDEEPAFSEHALGTHS